MKLNKMNLSSFHPTSFRMGELVPIGVEEVLAGDVFKHKTNMLLRFSPMVSPVMHPIQVTIIKAYIPHRLTHANFNDFISGGVDGADATVSPYLTIPVGGYAAGSLMNHLKIPAAVGDGLQIDAKVARAYNLFWNHHIRDQDLQTEKTVSTGDGSDTTTDLDLLYCNWEKDRYTTARTTAQKGAAVTISLGDKAYVAAETISGTDISGKYINASKPTTAHQFKYTTTAATAGTEIPVTEHALYADLAAASGIAVTTLREYIAAQRIAENMSRFGNDIDDWYIRNFGSNPLDSRLQRPEILSVSRQMVQISEVLQTGVDSSDAGVGTMNGHGIASMGSNSYLKRFPEHGYVMTFCFVRPKHIIADGIPKMYLRTTKEDHYMPDYAGIGQEAIANEEVYADTATQGGVFGYGDRYESYRHGYNYVSGDFTDVLNHWQLTRQFGAEPALNSAFVTCSDAPDRCFASTTNDTLYALVQHRISALRVVKKTSNPTKL